MNLRKREKYLAWAVGAMIALFVLNWMFIKPLIDKASSLSSQRQLAEVALAGDESLFASADRLSARWRQMQQAGLSADPDSAEKQAYRVLGDCAAQENLKPTSLQGGRTETVKRFEQITLTMTATSDLRTITRFVYRVQTAKIPLRITQLSMTSRKDGTDDLNMQITVSTLRLLPEKKTTASSRTVAMAEGSR